MANRTKWYWLIPKSAVPHATPAELLASIRADMARRGHVGDECKTTSRVTFDLPGMVALDRPVERFTLAGLRLDIPSEDVSAFLQRLRAAEERPGLPPYYKLHGWRRCVVLTGPLQQKLIAALELRKVKADARSAAFYADRQTPQEALRAIQPHAPEKAYGPDKHAAHAARGRQKPT